jgi:hypothetical protein
MIPSGMPALEQLPGVPVFTSRRLKNALSDMAALVCVQTVLQAELPHVLLK